MKTFDQCKDEVANKANYESFDYLILDYYTGEIGFYSLESSIKQLAELYAQEVAKDAWERACEAYEDLLFIQNLERPLNKPPYQPNQEKP